MNSIVFVEPNKIGAEPFTTSDVIANCAGVQRRAVTQLIRLYQSDIESFGVLQFEIAKPQAGSNGGRPQKIYHLNEQQATLLLTYLKNTEPVRQFKKALVHEFYSMKHELMARQLLRIELKPIRREMTDVIQEVDASQWAYKKYTDLAYKTVTGKTAAQLRKDRGAPPKSKAIEYMTASEIESVSKRTSQISVLLEMGLDYQQVKAMILNHQMLGRVA